MTARRHPRAWGVVAFAACLAGCAAAPRQPEATIADVPRCVGAPAFAAGAERATLWTRDSAEYRATSETLFRAAQSALVRGLADPRWTAEPSQAGDYAALPPAVVMDVDETVLDNTELQAAMLREGICIPEFPALWDSWVARRSAPAVPGAVEFIRAARAARDGEGRAVRVFFVTNRECAPRAGSIAACPQQDDTQANLASLGLGAGTLADDLMLKGERPEWDAEKLARRQAIAATHRIVLIVGDDLADFLPGVRRARVAERDGARCAFRGHWGQRWFMLPNPMYGSWLVALGPGLDGALAAQAAADACPDAPHPAPL